MKLELMTTREAREVVCEYAVRKGITDIYEAIAEMECNTLWLSDREVSAVQIMLCDMGHYA